MAEKTLWAVKAREGYGPTADVWTHNVWAWDVETAEERFMETLSGEPDGVEVLEVHQVKRNGKVVRKEKVA